MTHRDAVLLGNLNYQVENGGFCQWVDNGYGADVRAVRYVLQRLGADAGKAADAMLARLEPHIDTGGGSERWVMGEPYEETCPDCGGDSDPDCETCMCTGRVPAEPESEGWDIAKSLDDEYDAIRDELMGDIETWLASRALSRAPRKVEPGDH